MMTHYLETKKQYPDCILFYRLGDFYEMFFEDAKTVSRELELTLTGKDCGLEERAPMCGVPFHAVEGYLTRLVQKGYKVAIAEQMEDPKLAKGLVKREVIRVVTPGTITSSQALDETKNNYLMAVVYTGNNYGIATVDITTGDFFVTEVTSERALLDEINKFTPSELVCNEALFMSGLDMDELKERYHFAVTALENRFFSDDDCRKILKEHFHVMSLEGLGLGDYENGMIASGAVLQYLYETQKNDLSHLTKITPYTTGQFMMIDTSTRRNLELVETLREKQKRGSLLWVLDKTKTAMGARLLRSFIEQPLIDKEEIERRQQAIEELNMNYISREEIREYLNSVYDLERLMGRISYKTANPRDLLSFKNSLEMLPYIKDILGEFSCELLKKMNEDLDPLRDLYELIDRSIVDEPPITVREGNIIKDGYSEEADKYRKAKTEGKAWLADLETEEKEKTGIKNLKIKYNKVFGYYFEVTNSFKDLVPEYFIRKQTLTNAERYTTDRLKELEDIIMGAEDRLYTLEYDLFCDVRDQIAAEVLRIQSTAKAIAGIDVFTSLSTVSMRNNYVKPKINEKGVINIKNGRHPVVEKMIKDSLFVANDTYLDNDKHRISIITGPNMAGKSTYMRQVALIVLLAQIGSFVPAKSARIGIVDRIFTRIGASDDLSSGQSTFMVEMNEVASILRQATSRSLLILDEIGRGTSTFDGMSIARAVLEYCADKKKLGAKTLFATHYHELTEMEQALPGVKNYNIAVKAHGDEISFLRKIIPGGADRSYGIEVAKLAGLPDGVIRRAREILSELEQDGGAPKSTSTAPGSGQISLTALGEGEVLDTLRRTQVDMLTPLEAMNLLYEFKKKLQ